jgi:hypothetical protein
MVVTLKGSFGPLASFAVFNPHADAYCPVMNRNVPQDFHLQVTTALR